MEEQEAEDTRCSADQREHDGCGYRTRPVAEKTGSDDGVDDAKGRRAQIDKHGDEQDREDLAAADTELAVRRSRMHPGRPAKPRQDADE
ncbi:hypothetical protein GCM10027589_17310 [Actinocorallia lasiicapitis]